MALLNFVLQLLKKICSITSAVWLKICLQPVCTSCRPNVASVKYSFKLKLNSSSGKSQFHSSVSRPFQSKRCELRISNPLPVDIPILAPILNTNITLPSTLISLSDQLSHERAFIVKSMLMLLVMVFVVL